MKLAGIKLLSVSGTVGLAVLTVFASPFAMADDSGWYVGANMGQSRAKIDDEKITAALLGAGFVTTSITDDNHDAGYKIFSGYQFNNNFALEGGYFDLGQFGFTSVTAAPSAGTLNGSIKLRGLNLDAVGTIPLTEKFSVIGRVGLNYADVRDTFSSTGAVPALTNLNPSKHSMNYKYGLGMQYAFTEALGMRVEAERYRIDDAIGNKGDVDLVSVGLVYRFGDKKQSPAPQAVAPKRVAVAPIAEPVAAPPEPKVVVAPPPIQRKVTFAADSSVDSLFDFDKSILKPSGKQALDMFSGDLIGASFDVINVTGHTDRIGSHSYNMKLSTQRAEAVKAYLIESAGISADKITAKGVDGAEPITKVGDCKSPKSKKASKALILCLAPDRRVEVEVKVQR